MTASAIDRTGPLQQMRAVLGLMVKVDFQIRRSMKTFINIIGTATGDSSPSLILHYDSQRYLFNCGEGTQRLCTETKMRLSKLRTIFVSQVQWDCIGGIPGKYFATVI